MDIAGINTTTTTTTSAGAQALDQISEDYNTFLQLLTAQISNQDPLEPMDSTTFVTQLAQLSQVEQAAQSNVLLEGLSAQLDAISLVTSASLVGQDANFASSTITLDENGARASYILSRPATSVAADIFDPTGQLIYSITGLPGAIDTEHPLIWDGVTDTGQVALLGDYQVRIRAVDEQAKNVEATTFRDAEIQEAALADGQIYFRVQGDEYIAADSIRSIR